MHRALVQVFRWMAQMFVRCTCIHSEAGFGVLDPYSSIMVYIVVI